MTDEELDREYDAAYFCAMQPSEGLLQYPGTYTNGHAPSESWCTKTPTEILANVNALLVSAYTADTQSQEMLMSYNTYCWLFGWPVVRLLLRSRKSRRPRRFTRKVGRL